MVSTIALVLAVPVSIGIALFTTEVVHRRLRSLVVTTIDLLAAVPSVVYGLWGIAVLAPNISGFYDGVADLVEPVPVLHTLFGERWDRPELHDRRDHPGDHDHADHHLGQPRGAHHRALAARRPPPWPSAPPGGR